MCFCIRSHEQPEIWNMPFSVSEAKCIESLQHALNSKDQPECLENLVKDVMLRLITTSRWETFKGQVCCPIWRFLISSSILQGGGFADAEAVSHTCAALKFCWRAMVFEESIRLMDLDYTIHATAFESTFRRYVEPGNRTSWDSIKEAMEAAKNALFHKTTLGGFEWVDGSERTEMIMNGKPLSLECISTAVVVGLRSALKHMTDNILHEISPYIVPRIVPIDQRRVDPDHLDYSFITDANNPYINFKDTLLQHLVMRGKLGQFNHGKFQWNRHACIEFLKEVDVLREQLFTLIRLQYGALSRVTEDGTVTWRNDGWRQASLKFAHGMVVLINTHNKTNALTGTDKPIAR